MHMNNSNNLKINVTFTKFIDLPMFASVCIKININLWVNNK